MGECHECVAANDLKGGGNGVFQINSSAMFLPEICTLIVLSGADQEMVFFVLEDEASVSCSCCKNVDDQDGSDLTQNSNPAEKFMEAKPYHTLREVKDVSSLKSKHNAQSMVIIQVISEESEMAFISYDELSEETANGEGNICKVVNCELTIDMPVRFDQKEIRAGYYIALRTRLNSRWEYCIGAGVVLTEYDQLVVAKRLKSFLFESSLIAGILGMQWEGFDSLYPSCCSKTIADQFASSLVMTASFIRVQRVLYKLGGALSMLKIWIVRGGAVILAIDKQLLSWFKRGTLIRMEFLLKKWIFKGGTVNCELVKNGTDLGSRRTKSWMLMTTGFRGGTWSSNGLAQFAYDIIESCNSLQDFQVSDTDVGECCAVESIFWQMNGMLSIRLFSDCVELLSVSAVLSFRLVTKVELIGLESFEDKHMIYLKCSVAGNLFSWKSVCLKRNK